MMTKRNRVLAKLRVFTKDETILDRDLEFPSDTAFYQFSSIVGRESLAHWPGCFYDLYITDVYFVPVPEGPPNP